MSEKNHTSKRPVIAVTMGDPAGVGPELCLHLLNESACEHPDSIPVVIGDARILKSVAARLGMAHDADRLRSLETPPRRPSVFDLPSIISGGDFQPGKAQAACGAAAAQYIETAVKGCLSGQFAGMVTAPINKHALNLAGVSYPGHTEMLTDLTGSDSTAMLLYSDDLAVGLVTCHRSLRSVPDAITTDRIVEVAVLLDRYLRWLRDDAAPRLAILGLNPHAGEEGLFGDEDQRIVAPALAAIRSEGVEAEGPLPPDTAFTSAALARYQGHVVLYHDQGLIPFKMRAFDLGVNITMGLKIVRTSPDHGTAFDLAWKGEVKPASFITAYDLAVRLARASASTL